MRHRTALLTRRSRWLAPIGAAVFVSAIVCEGAAEQQVQKMSLEAHIQQLTGPDAVDCGTQQRGTSNPEAMQRSLTCARDMANQHKAFRFIQWVQGEDSLIAFGVLAEQAGSTLWFDYDSAPCGGPYCAERFLTKPCQLSNVVVLYEDGRHKFMCIR